MKAETVSGGFENLMVRNIRGLRQCELPDLGRVNVICGKNNSGKSTPLEGINDRNSRRVGRRISAAEAQPMVDSLRVHDAVGNKPVADQTEEMVHELIATDNVWYDDQGELFVQQLKEETRRNGLLSARLRLNSTNWGAVRGACTEMYRESVSTVLLPRKRSLELSVNVQTSRQPSSSGPGLLDYLLLAKNQPSGSDDRKVYDKIATAFRHVSAGYDFEIFLEQGNEAKLFFADDERSWIEAVNSGVGLQDLMILPYFAIHPAHSVVLIGEPESHLHPDMQERLLCKS